MNEQRVGYRSAVRGLIWAIMALLRCLPGQTGSGGDVPTPSTGAIRRIAPALTAIASGYKEAMDLSAVARQCGLSNTHFRRLFKEATHFAPHEYLSNFRVQMAAMRLQNTHQSVLETAMDVGYQSLSSFSRDFKSRMGISPRQWRKANATGTIGIPESVGSSICR